MSRVATTWFVTMPARWTDDEVRPILGLQWGYDEDETGVTAMQLRHLTNNSWNNSLEWLRSVSPVNDRLR